MDFSDLLGLEMVGVGDEAVRTGCRVDVDAQMQLLLAPFVPGDLIAEYVVTLPPNPFAIYLLSALLLVRETKRIALIVRSLY